MCGQLLYRFRAARQLGPTPTPPPLLSVVVAPFLRYNHRHNKDNGPNRKLLFLRGPELLAKEKEKVSLSLPKPPTLNSSRDCQFPTGRGLDPKERPIHKKKNDVTQQQVS